MKRHTFVHASSALALAFALASGFASSARSAPMQQAIQPAAVPPAPAVQAPQHRLFGTLESATGSALIIRLRNGRDLHVDASQAFALKRVAEPLFRGKPTVVEGTLDAGGTLHATAVQRGASSASHWGTDL